MSESKRSVLVAFFIGVAVFSLQKAGSGLFIRPERKMTIEDSQQESTEMRANIATFDSALHPSHQNLVEKSVEKHTSEINEKNLNDHEDFAKSSHQLHSIRARVNRDEWDQVKGRTPEILLYFIDRYPNEIAEEIIRAYH